MEKYHSKVLHYVIVSLYSNYCIDLFTTITGTQPLMSTPVPPPPSSAFAPPPESTPTEQVPPPPDMSTDAEHVRGN